MDKKLIIVIVSVVFIVIVVGVLGSPDETETLSELELGESYNDDSINFSSNSFSADSVDLSSMTSDKLQAFGKALQFLENQNQSLENQLERAEKKTIEINAALGKLSDKINLIPTNRNSVQLSRSSLITKKFDSSLVSKEIITLCEEKLAVLSKAQRGTEKEYMAQKLIDEPYDQQWTTEVDTIMSSVISKNNLAGSAIEIVSCRTSICEISIKHENLQAVKDFHRRLPMGIGLKYKFSDDNDDDLLNESIILIRPIRATSYN